MRLSINILNAISMSLSSSKKETFHDFMFHLYYSLKTSLQLNLNIFQLRIILIMLNILNAN